MCGSVLLACSFSALKVNFIKKKCDENDSKCKFKHQWHWNWWREATEVEGDHKESSYSQLNTISNAIDLPENSVQLFVGDYIFKIKIYYMIIYAISMNFNNILDVFVHHLSPTTKSETPLG